MVEFPPFRLDPVDERLWKGERQLTLRRKPFAILRYLVENPRRLVTHQELIEHVWGGLTVSESAMRSHLHELRQVLGEGVIETVIGRGYRFTAEIVATANAAPARVTVERTIVGREAQLAALHAAFAEAQRGQRQVCFVTGDPGIGKTTLIDCFVSEVDAREDVIVMRGSAIEQHGTPEAYGPVIELLSSLVHAVDRDVAIATLVRYAPTFLADLPHLVPDDKRDQVTQRTRTEPADKPVRELLEALEALASQHTLVVVLEDLQWSDVATLDLVALLGARRGHARLFVIGTARNAEAQTVTHPLNRVLRSLVARAGASQLALEHISAGDVQQFLDLRFPNHALPAAFASAVMTITEGTPLFLTSLLDDLVRRNMIVERDGVWSLAVSLEEVAAHRPDSVRQLIDMQLDRLSTDEQRVLEAGSTSGREFSTGIVAAALAMPVEHVDELCDSLARRSLFVRREGVEDWPTGESHTRYALRHGLVREVCLDRSAPVRRQRWHRLIAECLERAHGDQAPRIAHVLAQHFDQGQVPARAVHYYVLAAERDDARFASADALKSCRRARELLPRLPADATRDELELSVLTRLAQATVRVRGPVVDLDLFDRMVELARKSGDPAKIVSALLNLSYRNSTLAKYRRAAEILDEADAIAATTKLPATVTAFAGFTRAVTLVWLGDVVAAKALVESLLSGPIPFDPRDPGILGPTDRAGMLTSYLGFLKWASGDPDGAVADMRAVLALAQQSGDPFFLGAAQCHVCRYLLLRDEGTEEVRTLASAVLAAPEAAVWHAQAGAVLAWADARSGTLSEERRLSVVREFHERIAVFPLGATLTAIPVIAMLRGAGQPDEARAIVDESIAFALAHEELVVLADLLRLRGDLAVTTDRDVAERAYLDAIASARKHGARTFELRAANRLARLWQGSPRAREGRELVATALAAMQSGDTTADVKAARALIGELA